MKIQFDALTFTTIDQQPINYSFRLYTMLYTIMFIITFKFSN